MRTRTLAILTLVTLVVPTRAAAQQPAEQVGAKIGLNLSTLSQSAGVPDEVNRRIGLAAGGFGVWHLVRGLRLQGEALLSLKGAEAEGSKIRITYLEVPVMARWNLSPSGNRRFHVMGGAALAFKLDASVTADGQSEDVGDEIENLDLGWVVGGGVQIGQVILDARYTWGAMNVPRELAGAADTVKNSVFSVMVGLPFWR